MTTLRRKGSSHNRIFLLVVIATLLTPGRGHPPQNRTEAASLTASQLVVGDFEWVGEHPSAVEQPTDRGRRLHGAFTEQGRVYWAYGDWYSNTGPLPLYSLDPTCTPDTSNPGKCFRNEGYTVPTEALYDFRRLSNGKLYATHIDPVDYYLGKEYSRKDPTGWTAKELKMMYHIFDIGEFAGRIYLVGSIGKNAVVTLSDADEAVFQQVLTVPKSNCTFGDVSDSSVVMFFFAVNFDGKLYVQAATYANRTRNCTSKVTSDGFEWEDGPDLLPQGGRGNYASTFAGNAIYLSDNSFPELRPAILYAFDGTQVEVLKDNVAKYTIDEAAGTLYVIQRDGLVERTTDLLHWEPVGRFEGSHPTSIAIADHRVFVGTAEAKVYRSTFILQDPPTATFADVPTDHLYFAEIEALYHAGYTAGCGTDPLVYCPDQAMTRTESAVFVERGVHGVDVAPSEPPSSIFDDMDPATWGLKWATALWNDGYTVGCNADPLRFCPDRGHTRAEGAVFYLRMLHGADYLPPQPQGIFADVDPGAWHAKWDEAAYNASLIPACSPPGEPLRFCPDDPLTRGLAAYMMVQAKGLQVP